ncbi:hypothetical protein VNO77_27613 [Canavalia gladiata]|uniref:Uncharacterized protein n=1 Tax=Canavalia gladiata TaxID=3824 RepID=A0AAN9Q781_CANGL
MDMFSYSRQSLHAPMAIALRCNGSQLPGVLKLALLKRRLSRSIKDLRDEYSMSKQKVLSIPCSSHIKHDPTPPCTAHPFTNVRPRVWWLLRIVPKARSILHGWGMGRIRNPNWTRGCSSLVLIVGYLNQSEVNLKNAP